MSCARCWSTHTFFAVALLAFAPAAVWALTIHVDHAGGGDYLTIQGGIDAAAYGDTVLVAPGTYYEHLYMGTAADGVTLLSEAGAESTTIDNQGAYPYSVLHCEDVGSGTTVSGFTFTGGRADLHGGGIKCDGATVLVVYNVITDCRAVMREGGGIGSHDGALEVVGCVIEGNRAGSGGGVAVSGGSATINGNTIRNNSADSAFYDQFGGGLYISCEYAEIVGNCIEGNYALAGGGLLVEWTDAALIEANTITANVAANAGGGMGVFQAACAIRNNTITGNHAANTGGGAASIGASDDFVLPTPPRFTNNVFFANTSGGNESSIRIHNASPTPIFNGNFFADATTYEVLVYDTPSADTIDFTGNWWGTDDPDEIALKIRDCNDDPALLWCIDFSDWCTDPSCDGQVTSVEDPPEAAPVSWGRIKSLYR